MMEWEQQENLCLETQGEMGGGAQGLTWSARSVLPPQSGSAP